MEAPEKAPEEKRLENLGSKRRSPWKKGQSGNPSGKPKGTVSFQTLIRGIPEEEKQAVITKLLKKAKAGDRKAAEVLMKYGVDPSILVQTKEFTIVLAHPDDEEVLALEEGAVEGEFEVLESVPVSHGQDEG